MTPQEIAGRLTIVREACTRAGRPSCDIEVSAFLILYSITDVPLAGPVSGFAARMLRGDRIQRSLLAGSSKGISQKIQTYLDVGVNHIIMNVQPPYDPGLLRRFAKEVMPTFR